MNAFEQAVAAHEEWKAEFRQTIRAGGRDLDVETVRRDNRCLLGLWLYGDGRTAVTNPDAWAMLRDAHAEFHEAASHVLALALAGRTKEATRAMEEGSQYQRWSATLAEALKRYAGTAGFGD